MFSLHQSVLILAALSVFISSAFANNYKCYSCDSKYDSKCGDPFNPESIPWDDCRFATVPRFLYYSLSHLNSTGCMKSINEVDGVKRIIRSCFFGEIDSTSTCHLDPFIENVKHISCQVCTEKACNDF